MPKYVDNGDRDGLKTQTLKKCFLQGKKQTGGKSEGKRWEKRKKGIK